MSFKKKFILIFIWLLLLVLIINVLYGFVYENDAEILKEELKFNFRYYTRTIVQTSLNYEDSNNLNGMVSKNNISIKLNNINYDKITGKLKLDFDFSTNDNQIFSENIGTILKIYDSKKIFYNSLLGNMVTENQERLLSKNMNKKLYDSNLNNVNFEVLDLENGSSKEVEIDLELGENYEISDKLNIEFWDFSYKTADEFLYHRAIEPMGEFKFVINF